MTDERTNGPAPRRPPGVNDATVAAAAKATEALEWVERARGHLYDFHQMVGHADEVMGQAADALAEAGHPGLADQLHTEVVGRNVIAGRWTFQVVEEFDDGYYAVFRRAEARIRDQLLAGQRHVQEFEMKQGRRSAGHPGHDAEPAELTRKPSGQG